MMPPYDADQIRKYLDHIGFSQSSSNPINSCSLDLLTTLQRLQLVRVPFECLSLHYSTTRTISINPQDLFKKTVVRGRGGYCLENNTFFKAVLQSLGYDVTSVVCRISNASRGIHDGSWRGMSHMANIVRTNDGARYLVDVGFGVDGPCRPVPLISGLEIPGLPNQLLRLEYKSLPQHTDLTQRVWIYAQQKPVSVPVGGSGSGSVGWTEIYHFIDAEMFHADFEILNMYNMQHSFFASNVVVQRFVVDEDTKTPQMQRPLVGTLLLLRDTLKEYTGSGDYETSSVQSEEERITLLADRFKIRLSDGQRESIRGRMSELRPTGGLEKEDQE